MSEKLSNYASIAEILSSIAVLVTLIFLVAEVRTNTATLQRQVDLDRAVRQNQMMDSPYLPGILAKIKARDPESISSVRQAFMDRYELTFEESDRYVRYLREIWLGYEADFFFDEPGLDRFIRGGIANPDQALFWENSKMFFDEEFVRYVDTLQ